MVLSVQTPFPNFWKTGQSGQSLFKSMSSISVECEYIPCYIYLILYFIFYFILYLVYFYGTVFSQGVTKLLKYRNPK